MPFKRGFTALGTELTYDSGDYPGLLERTIEYLDYEQLTTDLARRRSDGEPAGLGMGFFVEKSGLGPFDGVKVTVDEAGEVLVITGVASIGQGVETVLAQVCADTLGVGIESVRVRHGQTDDLAIRDGRLRQPGHRHVRLCHPDRGPPRATQGPGGGGLGAGGRSG